MLTTEDTEDTEAATPETDAEVTTFTSISKLKKRFSCSTGKVSAEFARRLERERDEAREENKKFREALEWIAERYDDSKPMHQVAMDAYEMSCTARAALRKEETK